MELGQDIHLIDRWDPDARARRHARGRHRGRDRRCRCSSRASSTIPGFTPEHARRIRRVGLGGAPVPVALAERAAAQGIAIVRAYGSTEHPRSRAARFDDPAAKRHAHRRRADGRRRDPAASTTTAQPVAAGAARRDLVARSRSLRRLHRSRAHRRGVRPPTAGTAAATWGSLDADGFLTITDRVKDVIIRGGENISAAEIEEAIAALPQVAEVAVVAAPDDAARRARVRGRAARARGRRRSALGDDHRASSSGPASPARSGPRSCASSTDFPRTASGKVRKVDLRAQLRAGEPVTKACRR